MSRETMASAIVAGGVTVAAALFLWNARHERTDKKFHIAYKHPQLPLIVRLIAKLPASLRIPLNIAGSKPKPPLDGVDIVGEEYNPYEEIKELVPNKLWRVRYKYLRDAKLESSMMDIFGIDFYDPVLLDHVALEKRDVLKQMMETYHQLQEKCKGRSEQEQALIQLNAGCFDSQDMLVARLDNDGGLLLYNPCRMHARIIEWLKELNVPVTYIVSGSCAHTNMFPQAAKAFPSAKIICSKSADLKCSSVGMRSADLCYTDHSETAENGFQAAAQELVKHNVQLCHVFGDMMAQSLLVLVHGHLLETDLACYGNGERLLQVDRKDWDDCSKSNTTFFHLFYHAVLMNSSVPGYLPNYRIMGMDATSPFTNLFLDEMTETCCADMAASLRAMLAMDFEFADNVHSRRNESMPAEEFRKYMNLTWNWLDGRSLLT